VSFRDFSFVSVVKLIYQKKGNLFIFLERKLMAQNSAIFSKVKTFDFKGRRGIGDETPHYLPANQNISEILIEIKISIKKNKHQLKSKYYQYPNRNEKY